MPVKFEFLLDTRRRRPFGWLRRLSGGGGFNLQSGRNPNRFGTLALPLQLPTVSGRQASKNQSKSRQKPGYVRKEFAETWLWSEELVK